MDQDQRSAPADSITSAPVDAAQLAAQLWLLAAQLEEAQVLIEHLHACLRAVRLTTPG